MNRSLKVLEEEIQDLLRRAGAGATFPPNCFLAMKGEFVQYESRESLTASFPVLEENLNPLRTMQGGFLAAAFDNVFGPLSYVAARNPCVTINLNTEFIRPVEVGDRLTITAKVVSRGMQILYMTGEAVNSKNKLVAIGTATATVARAEPRPAS